MKITDTIKDVFGTVLDSLFPKKCVSCGEITEYGEDICASCRKELTFINNEKRCRFCGREEKFCECKKYVYRFSEILSVFEYSGPARQAMIRYKVLCRPYYADFFVKHMAKTIVENYREINFDAICYVPSTIKSELKRGFNPPEVFAKKLSKLLLVPKYDVLFVAEKRESQHKYKNNKEKRFENAAGKYACNREMSGKTVLLIDDVMTTGATLDDCTRALMFAGAERVYCVTALITVYHPKKLEKTEDS